MYLKVWVRPGAKKESAAEKGKGLLISVKEPAARNLANTRVRELVAARYGLSVAKVRIISGHSGPSKLLSIAEDRGGT